VNKKIKWLAPLEGFAQAEIFIVNQASWFWGWGGLWLWPFLLFLVISLKSVGIFKRITVVANIAVLHGLLLILSSPLPRYVIATILLGIFVLLRYLISGYIKLPIRHLASTQKE
jgi:ABC-type microcin C transport system permease subunit YejB